MKGEGCWVLVNLLGIEWGMGMRERLRAAEARALLRRADGWKEVYAVAKPGLRGLCMSARYAMCMQACSTLRACCC